MHLSFPFKFLEHMLAYMLIVFLTKSEHELESWFSFMAAGYLKTHDFLQPLERGEKNSIKEEDVIEIRTMDKPPPPAPPPNSSVEHLLPGGIGTYSISHISYFNQRLPKPEGSIFTAAQASTSDRNEENSNCSSYTGSGFTLWEESTGKKGKTGKENAVEIPIGIGKFTKIFFSIFVIILNHSCMASTHVERSTI